MKLPSIPSLWGKRTAKNEPDLSGSESLFGSIGGTKFPVPINFDFYPTDGEGGVIDMKNGGTSGVAKWMGLSNPNMQWEAYNLCSPLAAVIDRLAEADSNGIVKFIDEDEEFVIKSWRKNPRLKRIKELINNPNPWQTGDEFDAEQTVICKIFGYSLTWAICPAGMDKSYSSALINLNPSFCTPNRREGYGILSEKGILKNSPIESWTINYFGISTTIPSEEIMIINDGFVKDTSKGLGLTISKITGLDYFISNICAAMEADNVLLKKKGPLGVFSYDAKSDMAGTVPFDPKQKRGLTERYKRYGLTKGQLQYIISGMPIKWNPISFSSQELETKSTLRSGIDGICDRFAYPAELMSGKNATYENRDSAEKYLYQNNVIPFSLRKCAVYNKFFGLKDGVILRKFYNHLPVLQEDILHAGEAYKAEAEGLDIEWKSGMITWNQWQLAKDRDEVSGMDIYYPEWLDEFGDSIIQTTTKNEQSKTTPKSSKPKK